MTEYMDGDYRVREWPNGTVERMLISPESEPIPDPVPRSVTRFKARAALHLAGRLDAVETMMADPATPMLSRLAWQDALTFERRSPTVMAMGAALGLSNADLDALFMAAITITA